MGEEKEEEEVERVEEDGRECGEVMIEYMLE